MLIVSQDREHVYNMAMFQGVEYGTTQEHKHRKGGDKPNDIPTIFLSDGCLEELGRYETKERCLEILKEICQAYECERYSDHAYDQAAMVQRPYIFMQNKVYEMPEK